MYDGGARRWRDRAQGQAGNRARDAGACFTMSCCWLDVIDAPRLNAAALVLTAGGLRANLGIALLGRRKNNLAVGNRCAAPLYPAFLKSLVTRSPVANISTSVTGSGIKEDAQEED